MLVLHVLLIPLYAIYLPRAEGRVSPSALVDVVERLEEYQKFVADTHSRYVPFSVENVVGSVNEMQSLDYPITTLCGTMFGLRVFRHRLFLTDAPLQHEMQCSHEGKGVGSGGIARAGLDKEPYSDKMISNMYAPYLRAASTSVYYDHSSLRATRATSP